MTDHGGVSDFTNGPLHLAEERSVSPMFTPKGKELPLPPIQMSGEEDELISADVKFSMEPISTTSPRLEVSIEATQSTSTSISNSIESITAGQYTEVFLRDNRQSLCETTSHTPDMSDSPIFNTSSPLHCHYRYEDYRVSPQTRSSYVSSTDHSGRLSSSTMASSVPRAVSASNTSIQPDEFGIAFGSPKADKMTTTGVDEEDVEALPKVTLMKHVSVYQVGLGLTSKDTTSMEGDIGSIPQPTRIPFAVTVPPRAASRPRVESRASSSGGSSSKQSGGSPVCTKRINKKASFTSAVSRNLSDGTSEDLRMSPPTLAKIYTESIMSVGRESMQSLSPISPRSSSLKKAKSRQRVRSKTSQSPIKMRPPHLDLNSGTDSPGYTHKSSASSGSMSMESGEDSFDRDFFASLRAGSVVEKRISEQTTTMAVTPLHDDTHGLMDYLAYSAAGLTNDEPEVSPSISLDATSPASSTREANQEEEKSATDAIVKADGKRFSEIQSRVGSNTTHLLLSGCEDQSIDDFIDRVLPLVGESLLVLDLSNTRLSRIPTSLSCCIKLEEFNVSSTTLDKSFYTDSQWAKSLLSLRVFTANHCSLPLVPSAIAEMKNLVQLSLQHNRLFHLPSWLHRLNHLETLSLYGNPFQGQWEKICRAFIMSVELPLAAKATLDGNSASAPITTSSDANVNDCSFFNTPQEGQKGEMTKDKYTPLRPRPFIRKMKSQGGDMSSLANEYSIQRTSNHDSLASFSRRPSLIGAGSINQGEQGDKKWNTLIRKMGRKSSTSQLSSIYTAPHHDDSSIRERSNSLKGSLRRRPKMEIPAIPTAWPQATATTTASTEGEAEADQKSTLRGLMQYLQDLDDLGTAPLVSTPASELSMELSMGSITFSFPSSKDMSRSESDNTSISSQDHLIKDDSQKRIHILQEILATEDSYIRTLQELVSIYVSPAAAFDPHTGQHLISTAERKKVFANIEAILQFHQGALYPALRMVAEPILNREQEEEEGTMDEERWSVLSANISERVAAVMLKHAAFFRMYTSYVNGVNDAVTRVSQWRSSQKSNGGSDAFLLEQNDVPVLGSKEKKRIKTFLVKARMDSRHSQLSLETYLHLPVQRIPRYRLLLEDLVRHCPSHRLNDSTILTRALESICSIATLMNESKRQSEKNKRLLEWQNRVKEEFPSPLVQPHRQLIKDGPLILSRIVTRSSAFHVSSNETISTRQHQRKLHQQEMGNQQEIDNQQEMDKDGVTIQIDCLDQQSINKRVTVLLCNDITVILTNEMNHTGSTFTPVNLYAVLRIKDGVELIGEKTLRVVDAKHILYFTASTPMEAQEWQEVLSKVNQR